MDRTELIEGILRLTPTSTEKQARSRPLLNGLSYERLRETYDGLTALIADGRQSLDRMPPEKRNLFLASARAPSAKIEAAMQTLDQISARVEARKGAAQAAHSVPREDLDPVIHDRHLEDLDRLTVSIPRWNAVPLPAEPAQVGRLAEECLHAYKSGANRPIVALRGIPPDGADDRPLVAARDWIARLVRHPMIWSDTEFLDRDQTIEALARVENHVVTMRPEIIVAMNPEGQSISRVIVHDLGLRTPILEIHGSADQRLEWRGTTVPRSANRSVCIIGHVAWSGDTILEVIRMVRDHLGAGAISVAVLASSAQAAERTEGVDCFLFHQVTAGQRIKLAIDPTQMLRIGNGFRFPAADPATAPVLISAADLARGRDGVRAQFLV